MTPCRPHQYTSQQQSLEGSEDSIMRMFGAYIRNPTAAGSMVDSDFIAREGEATDNALLYLVPADKHNKQSAVSKLCNIL